MVDSRTENVLEMLVQEYIKTAEPVSSDKIARQLGGVSPATVRNIFTELTDAGFIEQPHVSGGRVPRTRAYRFFVDRLLHRSAASPELSRSVRRMLYARETLREMQEEFARSFRILSRFVPDMPIGFDEILQEPEFTDGAAVQEFGRLLDEFEDYRDRYQSELRPDSFQIIIGEENKIQKMAHMSMVIGNNTEHEFFFFIGPTRMKYSEVIGVMKLWRMTPR